MNNSENHTKMEYIAQILFLVTSVSLVIGCQKSDQQSTNKTTASFPVDTVQQAKIEKKLHGFWGIQFGVDVNEAVKIIRSKSRKAKIKVDTSHVATARFASIDVENVSFGGKPMTQVVTLRFCNHKFYSGAVLFWSPSYDVSDVNVYTLLSSVLIFDSLMADVEENYFKADDFRLIDRRDALKEATLFEINNERTKIYAKWSFPLQSREIALTLLPSNFFVRLQYTDLVLQDSSGYYQSLFEKLEADRRLRSTDF